MATVNFDSDGFFVAQEEVTNGDSMTVDASTSDGVLEVHAITHGEDCDVLLEADPDNDGTYERSVTLDSFTGAGYSGSNEIEVLQKLNMRLKIDNTGSGPADFVVTGAEK